MYLHNPYKSVRKIFVAKYYYVLSVSTRKTKYNNYQIYD